ncbi:phosphatase PAP2 family protein [Spirochaeta lutea]|uniref:Phosphatidic acid phosphatase type 2/haloperoxidase domain-containing protein n=1 Tax=Spirochaeta lutea TaxID=1480694 RepID=A0A098QWG3_9SPIO|nr:phosphatase PAP2 family protein [Spirochaeta lutea]KGE71748.1 hypothetical protein DC28_10940 [Spirochaeta lutea]
MDAILNWGMELIQSFQRLSSPLLDGVFTVITVLGNEEFYLLLAPLLFWCYDRRRGIRLTMVLLGSNFANQGLKEFFALPRPFEVNPQVEIGHATGYSLPSGHAQGSLTFWGVLAPWIRRGWPLALVVSGLIGISRVYLGVHYPSDVLVGWAVAAVILGVYYAWGDTVEVWILELSWMAQLALAGAVSAIMVLVNPADTATPGVLLGASIGLILPWGDFDASGKLGTKLLRYLLGIAGAGVFYVGLSLVFPGKDEAGYHVLRFLRYGLVGIWITLGAPWVFRRLGLAQGSADSPENPESGDSPESADSPETGTQTAQGQGDTARQEDGE